MTDIKRIGDAGIHTVEGNLAGSRAAGLSKKREKEQQEYEQVKNKIKLENKVSIGKIDDKFSSQSDTLEQEFRRKTIGLVSLEEFRNARAVTDEMKKREQDDIIKQNEKAVQLKKLENRDSKRKKEASKLSFQLDEEDENQDVYVPSSSSSSSSSSSNSKQPKKVLKNPEVDTSFLPDREREKELQETKEKLQAEWLQQQEVTKNEVKMMTSLSHYFLQILSQRFNIFQL